MSNKKTTIIIIIALILIIGFFLFRMPSNLGTLELRITDIPSEDIESLILEISDVQVQYTGNQNISAGWFVINNESMTFDLIQLSKTPISQLIGSARLFPGKYNQIRLNTDSAKLTLKDGSVHNVTIPSRELKLIKGFDIIEGKRLILTLDFDAGASIHKAGDKYILRPTVKIIPENVECIENIDCPDFNETLICGNLTKCQNFECIIEEIPC